MGTLPGSARTVWSRIGQDMRPRPPMSVSRWLSENLVLIDGPRKGQFWSAEGAPYLPEIADCLGEEHPCNLVTIRKSQQSGASILGLGWMLYIADQEPENTLYGVPGIDALRDINGQKLQPLIDAWQRRTGRVVIEPQTSRSGSGSTTYEKKFPGGYIALGNANSVMDLSSKTTKKGVKDELSKWAMIPGFGDPEDLFFGRFTAFRATKDWKILEISTPEIDTGDENGEKAGHCRIDRSFKRSDQRFWNVTCPACENLFVHDFARLRIDAAHPHRSRYECRCGHLLSEAERVVAVRGGRWIASIEEEGRHPGFHIDAFISLMMSYEAIAEDWLRNEKKGESGRKDFSNLTLGLPYRQRGDAPDHVQLMERREDSLKRHHVPPEGLLLVAAADVQMRGIWYEVAAFGADGQSWTVDADYIPGDPSDPRAEVYQVLLDRTLRRRFPDAFGRTRAVDALGIDTGYLSNAVYGFVRLNNTINLDTGRDMILALDGVPGWKKPPIGQRREVEVDLDGRKIKGGVHLHPIGTWGLKSWFYNALHKRGIRSGEIVDPPGYCHFGMWQDETYFRQITAEQLEDVIVKGQVVDRRWKKSTDNHLHDCRIYAIALAEYLGLSSMSPDEWAALARSRGLPDELTHVDLFTPKRRVETEKLSASGAERPPPAPTPAPEPAPPPAPAEPTWFDRSTDWF
ncbi:terminase gpA endonuclease subunit [Methylobacterium sp. WSM2598]|uniref:terminase gpA endonuclease subunit n=1 Tax=Methylobacterium sp. WSM2598 TaxID=398261 RepID=UPI00038117E7|nr:terminase gpA endonuclease subunit [Methylobacterium sp. WSM2598]